MSVLASSISREELSALLGAFEQVQAAALYGSVARGDAELHSDLDLLILCSGGQKRDLYDDIYPGFSKKFERLSLSLYSPRELSFLAKAQSLFLLHLQRESVLLLDRTGLLTNTLNGFYPKTSYKDDFEKSLELLDPLKAVVKDAPNNLHREAYVYSLFRVFGVYLLAEHGVFEFSKSKMTQGLRRIRAGQLRNIDLLSDLRLLNANFFSSDGFESKSARPEATSAGLKAYLDALAEMIQRPVAPIEMTFREAVSQFVSAAQQRPNRLGYRLRTWFLLLVYDGLNLFSRSHDKRELTSFEVATLIGFLQPECPDCVKQVAVQSLEYLRNYPLKYFLLDESKIPANRACELLSDLSDFLAK